MQRRLDLAGLASIGLAVYLGYVIYLGWNGGTVGDGSHTALSYAVGAGAIVVPVALGLAGIGLILRPFLPSPKSVAVGVAAIACGLLLALAAQTAGLGPEGVRKGLFDPDFFPHHGGGLGEVLYWATTTLFQRLGAHIIAVVLVVSGLLLLTGRSVSDMVRAGRRGLDRAKRGTVGFATAIKESRINTDPDLVDTAPADTEPVFGPPEPVADGEDFQVLVGGDEQETEKVANFDEAVRVAEEPDTSELQDLEESDEETIRVAKPNASEPHTPGSEAEDAGTDGQAVEDTGEKEPVPLTPMGEKRGGVTESEEIDYEPPVAEQVLERGAPDKGPDKRDHEEIARNLLETLGHFGVEAKIVGTVSGPHVSRYELKLAPGTKVSKITQLKDDLAYALASTDIRILAPIPGKQAVGVEVPNQRRRLVRLGDIYGGRPQGSSPLAAWLGKDISGSAVWTDLQKMPHALIAGTTGSGKSGSVNAILSSILLHASPNEVRMVLVDPKRVELNHYEKIPHLLTPVVTSPRLAANVLNNLIARDGEPLRRHGAGPGPQPGGAQPGARARGRGAAPAHPLRDRRARRPDDGRPGRGGGRDHPPGPEVQGGRDPPAARHAASVHRHHHGDDQGQHPRPDRLRRLLPGRLAGDPRPGWRRDAPRSGRHALPPGRDLEDAADPGRLHHGDRDRQDH